METPTLAEARDLSDLLAAAYPSPAGDGDLAELLAEAAPVVSSLTCRAIGPAGTPGDEVPDWLLPVGRRAVVMKAEGYAVLRGTAKDRRKAIRGMRLRSFTAGPYSESYFGPDEAARARVLDPDPAVHEVLWALATEDCRARWLALWAGTQVPATAIQATAWGAAPRDAAEVAPVPIEDILVHAATPVRNVTAEADPDSWAQGEPDVAPTELAPFDCALFLPSGTESPSGRGRDVRVPTLLYLPERADGSAVALRHEDELLVVAAELNLVEGLEADAEVRYQVNGSPQPAGRPGEDVAVIQARLTRISEQRPEVEDGIHE